MADLPDIDTTQVSYLAYFNAIDQGGPDATEVNPEEALTDGSIISYTLYDNGFVADYELTTGRIATARMKTDGWVVVYIDRTADYDQNSNELQFMRGPWDFINSWTSSGTGDIENNTLERAINSLIGNLSNSGDIDYHWTNVGIYNYEYPSATDVTLLSNNHRNTSETYTFLYTAGTTLYNADLAAVATEGSVSRDADLYFEDQMVFNSKTTIHGVLDVLPQIDPDMEYDCTSYLQTSETPGHVNANILFLYE